MQGTTSRASPILTRSLIVLEMAAELVRDERWPYRQAQVRLRSQDQLDTWTAVLYGSDGTSAIPLVASGEVQVAIINPSQPLSLAARGTPPFTEPIPLRVITVIPSIDQLGLAVTPHTGLTSLADLRERRYPLRLSIRGARPDHSLHMIIPHVLAAAGVSLADIKAWGGGVYYDSYPPNVAGVERGERDAVFDEALEVWAERALAAGMRFLPFDEPVLRKLDDMGYRRAVMPTSMYRGLDADVPTIDFSGWPIYTHADVPDDLVTGFCAAIEGCHDRIPWQGEGPLPLDRMCQDTPEAPLPVPLHPAAERYWREHGYLN